MGMKKNKSNNELGVVVKQKSLAMRIWNHRGFYIMLIPVLVFLIIMHYWPMLGVRYAFYDFKPVGPRTFVGFKHFEAVLSKAAFWTAFKNTLELSIIKLILTTAASVVVSLFLNEMMNITVKKFLQTLIYLPHFMSWVVVASIFSLILSPSVTGFLNNMLLEWGFYTSKSEFIYWLADPKFWRPIYYVINLWKDTGWGTIIFLATLSGISPELYEAGDIDGATRFQKMRYITMPALANTIITVLILNLAKVMNLFESVFVLYNDAVRDVSDVVATYIYRQTFMNKLPDYGYTTAVGLFRSLIGAFLVIVCNWLSKKTRGRGIV
jgi:putative aldouronate transport system permease protein